MLNLKDAIKAGWETRLMKIVEINMMHTGSTGKIMFGIAKAARDCGHSVWTFSPRIYQKNQKVRYPDIKNHTYFGYRFENMLHLRIAQITGFHGCLSIIGTTQLLKRLDHIKPDIIHLHNLHNCTINIPMLFSYIRRNNIKCIWTLHDCWSMTGQCPYFTLVDCKKWKTGCFDCPQIRVYPGAIVDRTKLMWRLKQKWFNNIPNMMLVTPSRWLASLVKESFLKAYPIYIINNGINLSIFKPSSSNYRRKWLGINESGFIVLGVAYAWGERKGLDVFVSLAQCLPKKYQIVLVGTNSKIDTALPPNIISIHRTESQEELAQIYSAADVLVNPTREDNYPTVNLEAQACGTPVITFATGGSPETIGADCGVVVPVNNVKMLLHEIIEICEKNKVQTETCICFSAKQNENVKAKEYVKLFSK